MNPAWLRPTVRLSPWWPVAAAGAGGIAIGRILDLTGDVQAAPVAGVVAGAVAATVAGALDDRCHDLLAAVPTGPLVRLVRRLAVVVPAAALAWWLAAWSLEPAPGVASWAALAATGLAAGTWAARRRPELAAATGGATAVAWPVLPIVSPPSLEALASSWIHRPGVVIALAAVATVVGTCRGLRLRRLVPSGAASSTTPLRRAR